MLHFRATYWSRCSSFKAFLTYTIAWKLQGKVSLGCCACWVRAAASKRLFEKPVVKGCALHMGWREERHPSTTVLTYWGWQLLHPPVQKAWAQQALLTGLPWELSGTDSDLGAALWRRTGARLKASLHCVSTGFLCWPSKEWLCGAAWGKGEPATPGVTSEMEALQQHCHTSPSWMQGKHQLGCLGSVTQLQRQHRQLVQGAAASPTHTHPSSRRVLAFKVILSGSEVPAGVSKRAPALLLLLLGLPLHQWCCCSYEFYVSAFRDNLTNHIFFRDHKQE